MQRAIFAILLTLGVAAIPAHAHHVMGGLLPQTFVQGLLSGLGHPLIGLDHAAFIVCAGFFLALVGRGMLGAVALVAGSLAGALAHLAEIGLPGGEILVSLSVILMGAALLARHVVKLSWLLSVLAIAGIFHGFAYGESIFGAEPAPLGAYLLGFSLIQFGVAASALLMHRRLLAARESRARQVSRAIGAATGITGLVFLLINVATV